MTWPIDGAMYCINLDKRPDRWNDSIPEFQKVGLTYVEHVVVTEPEDNRWLGFNRSMHMVLQKGLATGKPFIIFEDDIAFSDNWRTVECSLNELPDDFDLFYLGANIIGSDTTTWDMPVKFSQHLALLRNCWQSHAIMYSHEGAKFVLDNFNPESFPVLDEWLRVNVMPRGRSYLASPMVCYQRPNYSDLWRVDANYGVHEPGNKYLLTL